MTTSSTTKRERNRVAAASLVGTALEWYDFYLYSAAAALVFNKIMFVQSTDPTVATMLAFGTFAAGYLVRPLGGLIFGYIGDKVGRRNVLIMTLLIMGVATTLMAFVPTYAVVGGWAPVILVTLRVIQGIGAGAEFGGASIMSVEFAEPKRRGFLGSFPMVGVFLGLLLSSAAFALVASLPEEQFLSWGWRIPFAASIFMIGVALYIRLRITETPAFKEAQKKQEGKNKEVAPIASVFRHEKRAMLTVLGTQIASNTVSYLNLTFLASYLTKNLGMNSSIGPIVIGVAAAVAMVTVPALAALSDRIGRKAVVLGGIVFCALFVYPYFWIIDSTQSPLWITVAVAAMVGIGVAGTVAPQGAYFAELFTARSRFTGFAFSREFAGATFGGFTPLIAVALVAAAGGQSWLLALYVIATCVVGGTMVALLSPETRHHRLDAVTIEELRGLDDTTTSASESRETNTSRQIV